MQADWERGKKRAADFLHSDRRFAALIIGFRSCEEGPYREIWMILRILGIRKGALPLLRQSELPYLRAAQNYPCSHQKQSFGVKKSFDLEPQVLRGTALCESVDRREVQHVAT